VAVGDVFSGGPTAVAAAGFLDVQAGAGTEAVVHNIYHENDVELYLYDGTNSLLFDSDTGAGVYAKYAFHVTNTRYVRVKNTAAATAYIGYDGIYTK
jgi:hypothetical protein